MLKPKNDLLQGTLALLVLKTLARGPMHGYGLTLHIQLISKDIPRVEEGSLYPALGRVEQDEWVRAECGISENNPRGRYYRLTAKGRKQLAEEEKKLGAAHASRRPRSPVRLGGRKEGALCLGSHGCEAC